MSLKAALVRMLPPDHPSLVGTIVRLVVVGVGVADYLHTQNLERFLLICGIGVGGSYGLEQVGRQLLPSREEKSPKVVETEAQQQISDGKKQER